MKFKEPKNPNYAAIIVSISNIIPLEGMDRIQAAIILGNQVIVGKNINKGDVGIYFPVECQLDAEYLKNNNLYRKADLNLDPQARPGYFEENGRVRCAKLGGHKSEGIFMPLESVKYAGEFTFEISDTFDELDSHQICKKYVVKQNRTPGQPGNKKTRSNRKYESKLVENQFRFHQDTSMLYKNLHRINPNSLISITYKLHGTSGISSYVLCKRKITRREKIGKFLNNIYTNIVTLGKSKFILTDTEYDYLYSSRKVIKNEELLESKTFSDHYNSLHTSSKKKYIEKYYLETFKVKIPNDIYRDIFPLTNIGNSLFTIEYFESKLNGFKEYLEKELSFKSKGYYGEDIWGIAHKELEPFLEKGMTLYYEIAGYLPSGGLIQKDYDYGCECKILPGNAPIQTVGEHKIFIYRITQTNTGGKVFEFSAKQVQDWCKKNGLNAVPELFYGYAREFSDERLTEENWRNKFLETIKEKYNEKLCFMCKNQVPEEGVVIRIEGLDFEAYKQKSTAFYERETAQLDKGESNIEDEN